MTTIQDENFLHGSTSKEKRSVYDNGTSNGTNIASESNNKEEIELAGNSQEHDDVILIVSKEMASYSLGFCIDAGGTVTKLVYRSKVDYDHGVPRDVHCAYGKLRTRYFANGNPDEMIRFIVDNCDVVYRWNGRVDDKKTGEPRVRYQTGVGVQQYMERLDEALHIRTKLLSEFEGLIKGLLTFYSSPSPGIDHNYQGLLPLLPKAVGKALYATRQFMNFVSGNEKHTQEEPNAAVNLKPNDGFDVKEYGRKLMTADENDFAAELSLTRIDYPCILVMLGSAMVTSMMHGNGEIKHCDFNTTSAKTFLSVGMALTGAKSFNDLCEMASRGDSYKVDVNSGDVRRLERDGDDWYKTQGDLELFSLGKLSEEKYQGTYNKNDIAAGLLKSYCKMMVKVATLHARLNGLTSVIFVGSFVASEVAREILEACFFQESLWTPFFGADNIIRMAVAKNPGFLCALGTWSRNWELEQEDNNLSVN